MLSLYSSVGRQLRGDSVGRQLRGDSVGRHLRGDSIGRQLRGDSVGRQLRGDTFGGQLRGDSLIDSYFSTRQLVFILGRHQNLMTRLLCWGRVNGIAALRKWDDRHYPEHSSGLLAGFLR